MYEYTVINNDECNFYRKTIEGSKQDTIKETCKATYGKKKMHQRYEYHHN